MGVSVVSRLFLGEFKEWWKLFESWCQIATETHMRHGPVVFLLPNVVDNNNHFDNLHFLGKWLNWKYKLGNYRVLRESLCGENLYRSWFFFTFAIVSVQLHVLWGGGKKNHVGFHRVMSQCQWPKKHRCFRAEKSLDDLQFTLCVLGEIAVATRGCLSIFLPGPKSYKLTPSSFCYGPMRELTEHRSSLPHLAWGPDRPWFWFHSPSLATS